MTAEPRKPYDIDSLTDVALRVFAERGYDGASMDDVARAAGITKASIYHHVSGKEELLSRGLGRALDALFAVLDEPESREGRAVARLRHIVYRVADVTLRMLPELTVLVRVRGSSKSEREAVERRRAFDRIVTELIAGAQRDGDIRADVDPRLAARLIFGMSNSVVEWYRSGPLARDAIARAIVTTAFEGICTRV
ncbi:TetR family transcriptional regulator [Vulcanimicrobium alpinum]|uniref:TetR family transcriptional regulator n=1 Tax=Vulcanimicrobium alpinum TaxID=3016050 RepID=A0AAN1XUL3_UNVUL|nr:TetR/AcrR family transcriptional regulator [Vulcanimicrobium alpinum]BDE05777.1 TetR family transcriptional regulator [Vulcanimicrobium alpinum]